MPVPYRRACRRCIQAKRRCDLGDPCQRCRERSIQCSYVNDDPRTFTPPAPTDADPLFTARSRMPTSPEAGARVAVHASPQVPAFGFSTFSVNLDHSMWDVDESQILRNVHVAVTPDLEFPVTSPPYHDFIQRVHCAVKQMKTWPAKLAEDLHNPFVNLSLYSEQMPDALVEALGICSLYTHRTTRNEQTVHTCVRQAARRNLRKFSDPDMVLPHQRLAIGQALNLYRIVELFDGDIMLRHEAENSTAAFHALLKNLKDMYIDARLETDQARGTDQDIWNSWLMAESIRRTIVVGWIIECAYMFLRDGFDDDRDLLDLSFYLQKSLWSARSFQQWKAARDTALWLPVRVRTWTTDTFCARPYDLDELGMVLLVLSKGLDYYRAWVGVGDQWHLDLTNF